MYAREVDGKVLTFSVSGKLWNRSLVMYDKETEGLWSHLLGECMQGTLKGKKLEQIPSVMTDWASWSKEHPEGTVAWLSRTSRDYRREFYDRPERFVLGIAEGGKAKAWGLDQLAKTPVHHDKWGGEPVVVVYEAGSVTARLYARKVKGRELSFVLEKGKLTDRETGSTWEPITGRALSGPLKGEYLKPLPAIVSFSRAWFVFHPRSERGGE